jgi:hypothetical protein
MPEKILEIHSISSADGWYVDTVYAGDLSDCEPVCVFVLVTLLDTKYDLIEKKVVPFTKENFAMLKIGEIYDEKHNEIIHKRNMQL